jgi:hypothetical protein
MPKKKGKKGAASSSGSEDEVRPAPHAPRFMCRRLRSPAPAPEEHPRRRRGVVRVVRGALISDARCGGGPRRPPARRAHVSAAGSGQTARARLLSPTLQTPNPKP